MKLINVRRPKDRETIATVEFRLLELLKLKRELSIHDSAHSPAFVDLLSAIHRSLDELGDRPPLMPLEFEPD